MKKLIAFALAIGIMTSSVFAACPSGRTCALKYVQTGTFTKCRYHTECTNWTDESTCPGSNGTLNYNSDYQIKYQTPAVWTEHYTVE